MSCGRYLRQSYLSIFAGLLLSLHSVCAADAPWESWIPATSAGHDSNALYEKFLPLSKEQRVAAALHLIQKWDSSAKKEVFALAEAFEIPLNECFEKWARRDFDVALERAELWDGFGGSYLRVGVFRAVAKSDPVEAARRMRARFDPMSRSYYYYVTLQALTPALADQPARIILQALREMRSDLVFLDEFRWGDATATLPSLDVPWRPTDLAREWTYLLAQPPSIERDMMLCTTLHVWLEKDLEKAIALEVPPLHRDALKFRLEGAFPLDLEKAPDLLPVANFDVMRNWVRQVKMRKVVPEWRQWAAMSALHGDSPAKRHAMDTVMRLWLEEDEVAAIDWMQQLPAGPARETAQAACLEAEIGHLIAEDWGRAFSMAKAFPPGDRQDRCLCAVFAGAANEEFHVLQPHLDTLSVPDAQKARIRDAWRKGHSRFLQSREKDLQAFSVMLELEDAFQRKWECMEMLTSLRHSSIDEVHAIIERSSFSREDKDEIQLQVVLLAMDSGYFKVQGRWEPLEVSMRITDPQTRFVHQRAVIRAVASENLAGAREMIEKSPLTDGDKQRLREDWERVSKWEGSKTNRPQK